MVTLLFAMAPIVEGARHRLSIPAPLPRCRALLHFPVPLSNVHSLAPLGKLVPGDHTFPSPHLGVWARGETSDARVPVLAPGDMTVTSIGIRRDSGAAVQFRDSYTLTLSACGGLNEMYFHLITELSHPSLVQALSNACTPQGAGSLLVQALSSVQ